MRFFLLFILLLGMSCANAQDPMHYVLGKEEFEGVHLYSITQDDRDNSIWISSNKGLYHYDGEKMTYVVPKETRYYAMFGLTKDSKGDIYCFNWSGQIFKIVNKKPKLFYTVPKEYLKDGLHMFFDGDTMIFKIRDALFTIDANGQLIKRQEQTGYGFGKKNDTLFYTKQLDLKNVDLYSLKNGKEEKLFSYMDGKQLQFPYAKIIKVDNDYYGFNSTDRYMFKMLPNKEVKYPYPFLKHHQFKHYYSGYNLWFADYKNGVYKVPDRDIEKLTNPPKIFKDYYISGVMTDHEQNTWLLTFGKGIIIIPKTPLETKLYTIPQKNIKGIAKGGDKIYVGTTTSEIYQLDNEELKPFKLLENSTLEWFAIYPKESLYLTNNTVYPSKKKFTNGFVKKALLLRDSIYSATILGLMVCSKQNENCYSISSRKSLDVAYDESHNSFLTSTSSGAYLYKDKKEIPLIHHGKHLFTTKLMTIDDRIWAGTRNAIYIINNGNIVDSLTTKDGLLSNSVSSFRYEKPYVYITSYKGIQRYNTITKEVVSIVKSDGLVKGIADFEVLNNTIYALTHKGLVTFPFSAVKREIPNYETKITESIVNGNKEVENKIILAPDENNIEFSFLTTSYKYQDITYEYQLVGFEKKRIKTKSHKVNYSNLPAGTYTFMVNSFIKDHRNLPATFRFTVQKHWYKTWLFQIISVGLLLVALYSMYRFRINAILRKQDKAKMQQRLVESSLASLKAQMNPHFMFNAMVSIQSLVLDGKRYEAYEYLTQLSDFVRSNLSMSDVIYVPLSKEIQFLEMYLSLEKLRFKDLEYNIINEDWEEESIGIPSMVIQPFVENAVKHGLLHKKSDREINIVFKKEENTLVCIVEDNGIGRGASQVINEEKEAVFHASFSTGNIKRRFDILRSFYEFEIGFEYEDLFENDIATGTRVTIKLPYKNYD